MELVQMSHCASCSAVFESSNLNDANLLCLECRLWEHCVALPEDTYLKTGDFSCLFCNKLREKPGIQEFDYDAGFANDEDGADEMLEEQPDFPSGSSGRWKFYINLFTTENINVKLGDCVYYQLDETDSLKILRVQYLIEDVNEERWISGYQIVDKSYVKPRKMTLKRKTKEDEYETKIYGDRISVINGDIYIKLSSVKRLCCGLNVCDYDFGKPQFMPDEDIFSIGNMYDEVKETVTRQSVSDFRPCKNPCLWQSLLEPVDLNITVISEPSQIQSPSILKPLFRTSQGDVFLRKRVSIDPLVLDKPRKDIE
ncbi:hypothetical protein HDE_14473 [Halotydeus destructor]|nr:hypothetical protein HDE_14473 [Halotydeus destructor]